MRALGCGWRAWLSVSNLFLTSLMHTAGRRRCRGAKHCWTASSQCQTVFSLVWDLILCEATEAGYVHLSSCGLWHRHILSLLYSRVPEGTGQLCSIRVPWGLVRVFGQAVDQLWLWPLLVSVVLRLLVSLLAGSSEPYIRAV